MKTMYWITVLGNLGTIFAIAAVLLVFGLIPLLIKYFNAYDDEDKKLSLKWAKRAFLILLFCVVGAIFTPSETQLCKIYGIGGTIDYLQSNDKAKELPDKVIIALDRYLDELNKDDED